MTINAVRNRRNRKGLSANVVRQTVKFITNQPITPITPTVGQRGKPFIDSETGEQYYNYFIPVAGGTLPAGLSLNARTGAITGTPTTVTLIDELNFSVDVTIAVKDSLNHIAYKKSILTIVVVDPFVVQEKTLTYDGKVNKLAIDDNLFVSVTGGRPPYVYTVTQGELPPGIEIDQTNGKISGTPTDVKRTFISETQVGELPVVDPIIVTVTDFYETVVTNTTTVNFNVEDVIIAVPNPNVAIKGVTPLTVNFTAFSSVTLGVEPYVYFTPAKQTNPMPLGVTLNSETGVISGVYSGIITAEDGSVTHEEYKGTLQVSVRDQDNNISSKISKIDIDAYLPLQAVANEKDEAGAPITTFSWVATKPVTHKPLKALYGDKPYTFTLWFCSYIDKYQNLTQYDTAIPGVEINPADGTITAANGLLAGTYIIDFKVADSSGVIIDTAPRIMYLVDDAIIATVLTNNTEYQIYVNDQTSNLNVGYTVLRAELGVPPYTFKVNPKLPAGLQFVTTNTTCGIIGSPTAAGHTVCEFSVKDSTDMQAVKKHTITFDVAERLTTSADDIEITHILGDTAGLIDIFATITGGIPPYNCLKMFGQLPPEYTFKGANFTYIGSGGAPITVEKPKLWGNDWVPVTGGESRGPTNTFAYLGTYISYYMVSDSKGDVSGNRARVKITIVPPLSGTSNNVPPIIGAAGVTTVNFQPITVTGGIPPYTINISTSIVDPVTKNTLKLPKLNLKTYNPDTIYGVPDQGYTGKMYFYITDKRGASTPKFPVDFDILPNINAEIAQFRPSIMCVEGTELYEILHGVNNIPTTEVLTTLEEPLFVSVTGGKPPYKYFQCDSKGNAIKPADKLPKDFYIDKKTGVLKGRASTSEAAEEKGYFYNVADSNNSSPKPAVFRLKVNRPLIVETVNNLTNNVTFYNADGTRSNTKLIKVVDNLLYDFRISVGRYGSGRHEYQLRPIFGEADFYSNFTFSTATGTIALINPGSKLTAALHTKISVNVRDKFTGIVIESTDMLEIRVYPKLVLTKNPRCLPRLVLYRGKIITDELIDPVMISGGSGSYIVTVVNPSLPNGLTMDNNGFLTDAPIPVDYERIYTVQVDDAIFEGVSASEKFNMVVITPIVDIDVTGGDNKSLNHQILMTKTNMTMTDIINIPMVITVNVLGSLTSTSAFSPAFTIDWGQIHPETTVLIDIKGGDGIMGGGGVGGSYSTSDAKTRNGKPGGTGLKLNMGQATATIKGNGKMVAGGGGGGGAGGFDWRMMSLAKATRYITSGTYQTDFLSSKPYKNQSWDSMVDTSKVPVANGIGKITVEKGDSPGQMTVTWAYRIMGDPSPLDKAAEQKPGKPSPPVTVGGASGGRGAGGAGGIRPGAKGGTSPKGASLKASAGTPPDSKFIAADQNRPLYIAAGNSITPPSPVVTIDYSGDMQYGGKSPANDGEGPFAGEAGENIWSEEGGLYGCAGGGGGGYGGKGGDGGTSSPTIEKKPKDVPGGFGGLPGLALDAADCFITPILHPSTVVYGEIQTFIDDPDNVEPT
jgi:hypothetical protein